MRLIRQLLELNNRYIQSKPITMDNYTYRSSAKIGSRYIVFNANQEDLDDDLWDVSFAETKYQNDHLAGAAWNRTGSGDEIKVLNFISQALRDFVDSHHPTIITFTSEKSDGNRARLYKRAAERVLPEYDVNIDNEEDDDGDILGPTVQFRLVRKPR